jgi:hypothetical protein
MDRLTHVVLVDLLYDGTLDRVALAFTVYCVLERRNTCNGEYIG